MDNEELYRVLYNTLVLSGKVDEITSQMTEEQLVTALVLNDIGATVGLVAYIDKLGLIKDEWKEEARLLI